MLKKEKTKLLNLLLDGAVVPMLFLPSSLAIVFLVIGLLSLASIITVFSILAVKRKKKINIEEKKGDE